MRLSFIISVCISQAIFLSVKNCSDNTTKPDLCSEKQTDINEQRDLIRAFANHLDCNDTFECRYIAFGSKPCGGPWEYLIYSTAVDTLKLVTMVEDFNALEAKYNQDCGAVSDCMMVMPPSSFKCENNQCIPIY